MALSDLFKTSSSAPTQAHMVVPTVPSAIPFGEIAAWRGSGASRAMAMSIPAVAACRNLIAGTIAQLGITRSRGGSSIEPGLLLTQPDPSSTWAATIERTVDDLLFYGSAAWLVLARDGVSTQFNPGGLPVRARQIPVTAVTQLVSETVSDYDVVKGYEIMGQRVDRNDVIWFDAGNEGVLTYGARAIAQAYDIEAAARRMATVDIPAGVLQNAGHELGPDEAADIVASFQEARQNNSVAFLQNVTFDRVDINAHDLQLVEARAASATECARLFNVPVALIGASPTGNASALLYSNIAQNSAQFIQQAVGPLLSAIERTLTLESVTARGQRVHFDVGAYLRTDPQASVDYVTSLLAAGIVTVDEARSFLGIAPQGQTDPNITPGRV